MTAVGFCPDQLEQVFCPSFLGGTLDRIKAGRLVYPISPDRLDYSGDIYVGYIPGILNVVHIQLSIYFYLYNYFCCMYVCLIRGTDRFGIYPVYTGIYRVYTESNEKSWKYIPKLRYINQHLVNRNTKCPK